MPFKDSERKREYQRAYRQRPGQVEERKRENRERYLANRDEALGQSRERYTNKTRPERVMRKLALMNELGSECVECGFDHPAALQFHHVDPAEKSFTISDALQSTKSVSFDDLLEEAMKCELLCANCHAIRHGGAGYEKYMDTTKNELPPT